MSAAEAPLLAAVADPSAAAPSEAAEWGVYGQPLAVAQLRSDLESGRLAHAYLLGGPEGVGKATLARRLVQALHCEAPAGGPCLDCAACRRAEAGEAPDYEVVAIGGPCDEESHRDHAGDGSTRIRICQARRIARLSSLAPFHEPPHRPPRRVFVVDAADDLQTEAGHALLKTLEEPPATSLLILLATDPAELLPTIRSRCREIELRPMPRAECAAALAGGLGLGADEAARLAALARGRYGLAVRMHRDPSLVRMREAAADDLARLAAAGRNERFDYAATLAGGWRRDRRSVLGTLDVWRWRWREALARAAGVGDGPGGSGDGGAPLPASAAEAASALRATQRARQRLLENTNPQLAIEVLMLDLPELAGRAPADAARNGEEARAAGAP